MLSYRRWYEYIFVHRGSVSGQPAVAALFDVLVERGNRYARRMRTVRVHRLADHVGDILCDKRRRVRRAVPCAGTEPVADVQR